MNLDVQKAEQDILDPIEVRFQALDAILLREEWQLLVHSELLRCHNLLETIAKCLELINLSVFTALLE
jgi:hypothetical protein